MRRLDDQPIAETSAAPRRRPLVLTGIMLGMFMSAVESTIVASAMPVSVASIALLALYFREHLVPHEHTIDYGGSALLMAGSGALMLALTQAHELGATMFWGLVVTAGATIGVFLHHESVAREPMLRLDLWRNRVIAVGNVGATTIGAVMMGITAFVPAYVQGAMGRSPLVAGFALTV